MSQSHDPNLTGFPSTERIFEWINHLANFGHRKTGTAEGRASAEYIAKQLRSFGLSPVIEAAPTPCPEVHRQEFRLGGDSSPLKSFWVNGTGRNADLGRFTSEITDAELVYIGAGWDQDFENIDVAGKIVVADVLFKPWNNADISKRNSRSETYDPEGSLLTPTNKFDIYSPNNWPNNFFRAQLAGASGFIGILQNYMDEIYYNEDYTENGEALGVDRMSMPALWVSKHTGEEVKRRLESTATPVRGSLGLDIEYRSLDALNIHAVLEGQREELILVHSHHDAVFAGAVQDASGVSGVLAQAEYFARLPLEERPLSMMFAFTDTHFTDYVGHLAFITERQTAQDDLVLDVCIEHIAKEIELGPNNEPIDTGKVEPRVVYVSDESGLFDEVRSSFVRHDLHRTVFFPVGRPEKDPDEPYVFREDEVVSDAYYFAEEGIPVVSLVAGPMYLFHESDTIDRVAIDQLRPVGLAFAEITMAAQRSLSSKLAAKV